MTYVVTEPCVDCKHTDCAAVCPVEAFHELADRSFVTATDNYGFINHEGRLVYEAHFGSYPPCSQRGLFLPSLTGKGDS